MKILTKRFFKALLVSIVFIIVAIIVNEVLYQLFQWEIPEFGIGYFCGAIVASYFPFIKHD